MLRLYDLVSLHNSCRKSRSKIENAGPSRDDAVGMDNPSYEDHGVTMSPGGVPSSLDRRHMNNMSTNVHGHKPSFNHINNGNCPNT